MASGMNGQSFAFNGYLPIDKSDVKKKLKDLERISRTHNQTQLFIETPYRNNKLIETLYQSLQGTTKLCIACDISLKTEYIKTRTIAEWKKTAKPELHKRPCIFLIHAQ
jgi:16S rRNA (cytidine1402-2'-O)-methyltransferase